MNKSTTPRDFDVQESDDHVPLKITIAGDVETWTTLRVGNDLDIQSVEDNDHSEGKVEYVGVVDKWERVTIVVTRSFITLSTLGLVIAWVIIGLRVFIVTGNFWLLLAAPVLAPFIKGIVSYYYLRWLEKQ